MLEIDRPKSIKPCPLCNSTESVYITDKDMYYRMLGGNGRSSIHIECCRCTLNIWSYSMEVSNATYDNVVERAITKWNNIPRREYDDGK